jgi:Icc protein
MVRFIHLTDSHVGPDAHFSLYGKQPLAYLQRAVHVINDLPFDFDFVLHNGDLTDDGQAEAYELFNETIAKIKKPVYYAIGNHDNNDNLQRIVLRRDKPTARLDYTFEHGGLKFVVLDTRGRDPGGHVEPGQIEWLKSHCTPDGPQMVVVMHHVPVPLDTPWLDTPPPGWGGTFMFIDNAALVIETLKPARGRIRGVFCGHVHGSFQVYHEGLFIVAGLSCFAPLVTWPSSDRVFNDEAQRPMFNLVTITDQATIVRPRCLTLPD